MLFSGARSLAATSAACYWDRLQYQPFSAATDTGSFLVDLPLTTCPPEPPVVSPE